MIVQVIVNGILAGLTWGLLAVGFTLIYRVVRFFHVAYAITYLAGAYAGVWLIQHQMTGVPLAMLLAAGSAMLVGCLIELAIYRPLRRRESSNLVLFLASLAVVAVGQNAIALLFGSDIQVAPLGELQRTVHVAGASLTIWQAVCASLSILLSAGTWLLASSTNYGCQLRAVASDGILARSIGIRTDRIILFTIAYGSALAGMAGFWVAYDTAITPSNGFAVLLTTVTAAIVGGMGSVRGSMLGGIFIGLVQHFGAWVLPAQWQDATVFLTLILFLCLRPEGFLGKPLKAQAA